MQQIFQGKKPHNFAASLLAIVLVLAMLANTPIVAVRAASTDPDYIAAVDQANDASILYAGSDNMKAAIASVLEKAKNGEAVTLVVSGSSTPAGAGADAGKGLADHIRTWIDTLDGQDNGNVTLVNTAIGSTENVLGVSRMDKDILGYNPDLVIIDFGNAGPHMQEAHEGMLTKLIKAGKPTICLCVCPADGSGNKANYLPVNQAYGVPHLDFKTSFLELSKTTTIAGLTTAEIYHADQVHPSNIGHELLAGIVTHYLQSEILDKNVATGTLSTTLPAQVTYNGFADAILVENNTNDARVTVNPGNWTTYNAEVFQLRSAGWTTSTIDDSITFTFTGGYFYMFFELNSDCGDLEVTVDGTKIGTITWAYQGTGYMNPYYILHENTSAAHTVTITLRDNANVANDTARICAVGASNFAGYDLPASTTGIVDEITTTPSGWYGNSPTYETTGGYEDGAVWLKAGASTTAENTVLMNVYAPRNMVNYQNGYLHMWLYVNDISLLNPYAGMIEITSSKDTDQEEIFWTVHDYVTHSGWNELYLPISAATAQGDKAFDIKNFDTIRIVGMFNAAGGVIGVDDIRFVNEKPEEPATNVVIGEIESTESWLSTNGAIPTVHSTDAPVGSYWIESTADAWPVLFSGFSGLDLSSFAETGYLHMWLYVSDASSLPFGEIELSSASAPDEAEASWPLSTLNLQTGWNELYLPFSEAVKTNGNSGEVNFAAINYIRIYAGSLNTITIGIDKMECVRTAPESYVPDVVLSQIEAKDSWVSMNTVSVNTTGAAIGDVWVQTINLAKDPSFAKGFVPTDLTAFTNSGYLHFWLHVSDASGIHGGQIELTSSGEPDSAEAAWNVAGLNLKTGWNELYLPLNEAITTDGEGGPINWTAVNYCRIYVWNTVECQIGLDKMVVTQNKVEPDGTMDMITDESIWGGAASTYNTTGGYKTGADWLKAQTTVESDVVFMRNFEPINLHHFADGYLHIWLYVDDIDKLRIDGGMIEMSSSGNIDNEELYWSIQDYIYADGWNELYLPVYKARKVGEDPIVMSQVDTMRIVGMFAANGGVIGIDEIYMTNVNPAVLDIITPESTWNAGTYTTTDGYAADAGWLKQESTSDAIQFFKKYTAIDTTNFQKGYLHMWLYVNDVTNLGDTSRVEIASAGTVDAEEVQWYLKDYISGNGWNELYLPLAEAAASSETAIDWTQVDCIRVLGFVKTADTSLVMGIDELYITNARPAYSRPMDPIVESSAAVWGGTEKTYTTADSHTEGEGWFKTAATLGTSDIVFMRNFTPMDMDDFAEGYLHLWLYIDHLDNMEAYAGMIELTSGGDVDKEELYWNLNDYVTKSGWNELYLPITDGNKQGGDIDMSHIDTIRIVGMVKNDHTAVMGIDQVYMISRKPGASATVNHQLWDADAEQIGTEIGQWSTPENTNAANGATLTVDESTGVLGHNSLAYTMFAGNDSRYHNEVTLDLTNIGFSNDIQTWRDQILWFWTDADLTGTQKMVITLNGVSMTVNPADGGKLYTIAANASGKPAIVPVSYNNLDDGLQLLSADSGNNAAATLVGEWAGWIGIPLDRFYENAELLLNDNEKLTTLSFYLYQETGTEGEAVYFDEFWLTGPNTMPNLSDDALLYRGVRITSAAPAIGKDISINFKMDDGFVDLGFSDFRTILQLNEVELDVTGALKEADGAYVFPLNQIRPDWMDDTISIIVYATFNGTERKYETHTYSVAEYCYNMLEKNYSQTATADELATLLVNMLNYGAASQTYTQYKLDNLVTKSLTETWKSWISTDYTPAAPDTALSTDLVDPAVDIKGVTLFLRETIRIRLRLAGEITEDMSVKITDANGQVIGTVPYEDFIFSGSSCYVYFDELTATQMRQVVKLTVVSGEEAVSNTLTYSIRSYADKEILKDATTDLAKLLKAMMLYGDAAVAYATK